MIVSQKQSKDFLYNLRVTIYLFFFFLSLLPKEAIRRANVRFVIEFFTTKINGVFFKYLFGSQDEAAFEEFDKEINASLVRVSR